MYTIITQKTIGKRLSLLRKKKGYSQEELSVLMDISRPSITQIELGNRRVDVLELQKFSLVLEFSIDELMSHDFEEKSMLKENGVPSEDNQSERVSIPKLQINKFKNVFLYILERCAGKPNVGETVLYKLLYFCDFNYYEIYEEHLTGAQYKKLPYGPVPQKLTTIIQQMLDQSQIVKVKTKYQGYPQTRYLPLEKSDLKVLKASEKEVIDRVIEQMSDWSATAISKYSHKDIPWMASGDGETINYELVFYREAPFSVRNYEEETES